MNTKGYMNTKGRFSYIVAAVYLSLCSTTFAPEPAAQVVDIPDPNLRGAIREALKLPDVIPLTQLEMLRLKFLSTLDSEITDLTGLEHATFLSNLRLCGNQIHNLHPLSGLIHLEHLSLCINQISDISPLVNLTNLKLLDLGWNHNIADVTPLAKLTQLEIINLSGNSIVDISPLADLTNLVHLNLANNHIVDISPLINLTLLEELGLSRNAITDFTPLIGLKNLKKLYLADNPFHDFSPLLELEGVELDIEINEGFNVVVEVPDPNLRQLIREALSLPEAVPLTQHQMLRLTRLDAGGNRGITNLTGLEYATNIRDLGLYDNPIVDISALAHLTKLEGFSLWGCQIVDLTPLRNLKNLRWIRLRNNEISDISPLSELTNLTFLEIADNQIVDFSPLANLVNLQELYMTNNLGIDISPLEGLNLIGFSYDAPCDIEPLQPLVRERIENRSLPSVVQMWDDVVGLDHLTWEQRNVLHDLHSSPSFGLKWNTTLAEPTDGVATHMAGNLERAREIRQRRLDQNPNMVFLRSGIAIHSYWTPEAFPPNSDFWLRDAQGQIVRNHINESLINFLKPEVQELIIKRIVAVNRCGVFDGIMIDGFNNNATAFVGRERYPVTDEEIIQAMLNILRAVRSQVRDDFLILVNANRSKATLYAEYINGTFMETGTDYPGGYNHRGLAEIENTLLWSEENLQAPQINCLEGGGIPTEPPDSPNNRRFMRVFTTMSLTHSDGYVMYNTGRGGIRLPDSGPDDVHPFEPGHEHLWYSFWDADLGSPINPKAQRYQNVPGLFIREFTNGWAVYNRSGETQQIQLSEEVIGVESGEQDRLHHLPDLDGEIYLKVVKQSPWDVNQDGVTDIFDLIAVAKNFGKDNRDTDLNGDGTVDIFDLVLVAKHLGESTNSAAPDIGASPHLLSSKTVQSWIDMAHVADDGSLAFRKGIANLKRLLTLLVPDKTILLSNYPNPFNPDTWIPYHLGVDVDVTVTIYNLQGELVRQLDLGLQEAGYYVDKSRAAHWDGTNEDGESVASGVYFYKLDADEFAASKRMVVVK